MIPSVDNKSIQEVLDDRELHTALVKRHLATAQNRVKMQVDKNRTDREFSVGDRVLIKLQPYAQSSLVNRPYPKILYKFYGPYKILEHIGKAAY
jgi:hypothetical protein